MSGSDQAVAIEPTTRPAASLDESRISRNFQIAMWALVLPLLVVFGELGKHLWELPGMAAGILFAVSQCVAMTGLIFAICIQVIIYKRMHEGAATRQLKKTQKRISASMLGLSICFALANVGAAAYLGFFTPEITNEFAQLYTHGLLLSLTALLVYLAVLSCVATLMVMRHEPK